MTESDKSADRLIAALKERAKELNCLYEIEELFSTPDVTLPEILQGITRAIPPGWQYPDVCEARITLGDQVFHTPGFRETEWLQSADLTVQDDVVGRIDVCYTEERPPADEGPFLKEERKLISTIADRLERRIFYERLKSVFESNRKVGIQEGGQFTAVVDLLKRTDTVLLARIARKMLYFLSWAGIEEARQLAERLGATAAASEQGDIPYDSNRPLKRRNIANLLGISDELFQVAVKYFGEREVLASTQKWIMEDRSNFMMKTLENPGTSLPDIANAMERFRHLAPQGMELSHARNQVLLVALIQRLLSDDPRFVHTAKAFLNTEDFYDLTHRIIYPSGSHGKLGGKGSGLFLASKILQRSSQTDDRLRMIRTPKTWYLTSDCILQFISYNDLEEVVEQKYRDIAQVRQEYPYVVHVFKNSPLHPEIVKGLSMALDDMRDVPLIVRSSSLLEDRMGTSFAGKYKSLFIPNQGSKSERLFALIDAITEVYASTFNPDAIEYRAEHQMIDFHEEMGILIQEVVGRKVGNYFIPAFAGVAFASNEFRWSHRIRRESGLVRMVPGLGTRAVDRLSDDYPILISPGQPNLRVNVTLDERIWYSPKKIDVINLKTNSFESMEIRQLLRECGEEYPGMRNVVSILRQERLDIPGGLGVDFGTEDTVVTFDGLFQNTDFIKQIHALLKVLQSELGTPVDIEFAHDGSDLYLLQCRSQSYTDISQPAAIPRDISPDRVLFSANRYVTNGIVSDITHIVYVDPQKYGELADRSSLLEVGRAVGRLNQLLPKRQFILMGPGRWGSRGDIKLGVSVSYSDINNTAMLVEIARKHKGYMPEPSFGTHFFQDLVEASIRYLPLYPDDPGIIFQEEFLLSAPNYLPELLPEYSHLSQVIRVIEVLHETGGRILQVFMNGEHEEAVALFAESSAEKESVELRKRIDEVQEQKENTHWKWRLNAVERIAAQMNPERFGVKAMYLFGSTKNATAGPQSDIDLLIHFHGTDFQQRELRTWLEGWSLCLDEMNYLRTGYRSGGLLDVQVITDQDIRDKTSYAVKIGAITDAARPLALGRSENQ